MASALSGTCAARVERWYPWQHPSARCSRSIRECKEHPSAENMYGVVRDAIRVIDGMKGGNSSNLFTVMASRSANVNSPHTATGVQETEGCLMARCWPPMYSPYRRVLGAPVP